MSMDVFQGNIQASNIYCFQSICWVHMTIDAGSAQFDSLCAAQK